MGKSLKTIATGAGFSLFLFCLGCGSNLQQSTTQQPTSSAIPSITQVLPQVIPAGSQATTLKVTGKNFPTQAAILWNGTAMKTTVVDANTLTGTIGSSSLATPATVQLKVQNTQTMEVSPAAQITITDPNAPSPSALTLSIATLPQGVVGAPYSGAFSVTGGTAPYTWNFASGQLPPGLSLGATGTISGTPTSGGNYTFEIRATDSSALTQSATTTVSLPVITAPAAPTALAINSSSLPSGTIGSAYSTALKLSGGTAPYGWTFLSGNLPAGLSLNTSTGLISGTPTATGTASFTVGVADSSSPAQSKSVTLSIVIAPVSVAITTSGLPTGTVGSSYATVLQANGGAAPYTWSISSGSLPAGLSLVPSLGIISGTPSAAGTANLTATVADSENPAQTKSVTLPLVVVPAPLTITSSALSPGTQNSPYASGLQATGGTGPYAWSISSGSLPAGLGLSASSGVISGVPTANGDFSFGVTVKDAGSPAQTTSATISLSLVQAGTPLTISTTALAGGVPNTPYSATLNATGGTSPYTWTLPPGSLPAGLSLAASTGIISGQPSASSSKSLTFSVVDSSSPAQSKSVTLSLAITAPQLTITTTGLPSGTNGVSYSSPMVATGGTPGYTWSVTSGALPAGLTMAASTGVISGSPTANGTYNFTATVTDNGTPVQTASAASLITVADAQPSGPGTTWYVRPDGGTRYSSNVPSGQCNGKYDASYASTGGSGTNQNCAFNDFRFLWDDKSGAVGAGVWVIAGGDTVIVRGCTAGAGQSNASNPNCRMGWDAPTGTGANLWCYGVGSYTCYNPPIPAGTASQHTRILGQNYAACNVGGATNPKVYASNLTQIFGGFSLVSTFNLQDTQYVDVQCIELTSHNGQCTTAGSPSYPRGCNSSQPLDDFANNGFITNNKSSNLTLQDVYVHGFNASGLYGPIGGPITMTRVFVGFNAFAGWNFADQVNTPDAAGSQILAHYVTMIGNGCYEEYPVTHAFPAQACYDDVSNGFGDAWSGQDTDLDTFICDHCLMAYNTKDAFIGPHTNVKTLTITDSQSYGNMGAQWKWNNTPGSTTTFENNLTVGNCARFAAPIPGAPQSYAASSGLKGSYLSDYCRAAGNTVAINSQQNSTVSFSNNTFIDYLDTVILLSCGPSNNNQNGMCGTTSFLFTNNIFLGYYLEGNLPPGLFYINDPSVKVTQSNNIEYGNRPATGEACGSNGNICSDPLLVNQPTQQAWADQTFLDNFNFNLTSSSPAIGAGTTYYGILAADYNGKARPNPPTIGAIEP